MNSKDISCAVLRFLIEGLYTRIVDNSGIVLSVRLQIIEGTGEKAGVVLRLVNSLRTEIENWK